MSHLEPPNGPLLVRGPDVTAVAKQLAILHRGAQKKSLFVHRAKKLSGSIVTFMGFREAANAIKESRQLSHCAASLQLSTYAEERIQSEKSFDAKFVIHDFVVSAA